MHLHHALASPISTLTARLTGGLRYPTLQVDLHSRLEFTTQIHNLNLQIYFMRLVAGFTVSHYIAIDPLKTISINLARLFTFRIKFKTTIW